MISNSKIAVIDTTQGMEVLCFNTRLEMVRALIENAGIAPKIEYYGSPSHEAAVRNISEHCDLVLLAIMMDREQDAANELDEG